MPPILSGRDFEYDKDLARIVLSPRITNGSNVKTRMPLPSGAKSVDTFAGAWESYDSPGHCAGRNREKSLW